MSGSAQERWKDPDEWLFRAMMLAGFVPPGSSVLDVGAGTTVLKKFIPPDCTYIPLDFIDRGPGTFLCNLNAEYLPEFPQCNVVVFGGVLEYVQDVPRLLRRLPASVDLVIGSYAAKRGGHRYYEQSREEHGWVNAYEIDALLEEFVRAGFKRAERVGDWNHQDIFWARRRKRR